MSNNSSEVIKDSQTLDFNFNFKFKLQAASSRRACGTHITFKRLENGKSVAIQDDSNPHRRAEWKNWSFDEGE